MMTWWPWAAKAMPLCGSMIPLSTSASGSRPTGGWIVDGVGLEELCPQWGLSCYDAVGEQGCG